jgi:preprotein translocase subunit YajC
LTIFEGGAKLSGFLGTGHLLIGAASGGGGANGLVSFMPLIIIFVIFYFLLIRPQQKKQQHHKDMLGNLKRGERVITTGGIYGTIEGLTDTTVQLKIANQVKVKVSRSAIAGLQQGEPTEEE